MSIINSFLQKRKMHESQHGIVMVIIAYVLSFIMLVVGSDVFYNINSTAAGFDEETTEEADITYSNEMLEELPIIQYPIRLQSGLLNPYGMEELSQTGLAGAEEDTKEIEASVWLLGREISSKQYDSLMEQAGEITSLSVGSYILADDDMEAVGTSGDDLSLTNNSTANKDVADKAKNENKAKNEDEAEETGSKYIVSVSDEDIAMLERIVEAEASGEDIVGKILIANVVFNRLSDEEFPDTIEGVIFHKVHGKYQFSPVSSKRYWSVKVSDESREAVQRALEGEDYSDGALYFMARKKSRLSSAKWFDRNLDWLFKHGGHEFYKNK